MHTDDDNFTLTCADLKLDPERLSTVRTEATSEILHCLNHYFGRVLVRGALQQGLQSDLHGVLQAFAQDLANVISGAYTTEALQRSREASANMFEALAAGAHLAHRAVRAGEPVGEMAGALATIAAIEGRPHILQLNSQEEPQEPK